MIPGKSSSTDNSRVWRPGKTFQTLWIHLDRKDKIIVVLFFKLKTSLQRRHDINLILYLAPVQEKHCKLLYQPSPTFLTVMGVLWISTFKHILFYQVLGIHTSCLFHYMQPYKTTISHSRLRIYNSTCVWFLPPLVHSSITCINLRQKSMNNFNKNVTLIIFIPLIAIYFLVMLSLAPLMLGNWIICHLLVLILLLQMGSTSLGWQRAGTMPESLAVSLKPIHQIFHLFRMPGLLLLQVV